MLLIKYAAVELPEIQMLPILKPCVKLALFIHCLCKLEKVLHFSCHLKKSLNWLKVLEKYWISLIGLEKASKFNTLLRHTVFCEIRLPVIRRGKFGSSLM